MLFEVGQTISPRNTHSSQQHELQLQHEQNLSQTRQELVSAARGQSCPSMESVTSPSIENTKSSDRNTMQFNVTLPPQLSTAAAINANLDLTIEHVIPGIYLTKNFIYWKEDQLKSHGFTHIIIIDKHIQELYYPNQQPDIFKLYPSNHAAVSKINETRHGVGIPTDSSSINAFDDYCPPSVSTSNSGKEFEVLDLNFGEKSYLTTVLPNCYRAVKFINKALQSGGTIFVIDCNGGEQKCITIIVAYLMYKHNISFSDAFARLKEFYKKADLDRFYKSQLYEYEPILQVQRAQSRGHSCSRDLHAAILKRKKPLDDDDDNNHHTCSSAYITYSTHTNTSALLDNCNPLNRFDATQMERQGKTIDYRTATYMGNCNETMKTLTRCMGVPTTAGWHNYDDYAME